MGAVEVEAVEEEQQAAVEELLDVEGGVWVRGEGLIHALYLLPLPVPAPVTHTYHVTHIIHQADCIYRSIPFTIYKDT